MVTALILAALLGAVVLSSLLAYAAIRLASQAERGVMDDLLERLDEE
jgi:hypothetical protein